MGIIQAHNSLALGKVCDDPRLRMLSFVNSAISSATNGKLIFSYLTWLRETSDFAERPADRRTADIAMLPILNDGNVFRRRQSLGIAIPDLRLRRFKDVKINQNPVLKSSSNVSIASGKSESNAPGFVCCGNNMALDDKSADCVIKVMCIAKGGLYKRCPLEQKKIMSGLMDGKMEDGQGRFTQEPGD